MNCSCFGVQEEGKEDQTEIGGRMELRKEGRKEGRMDMELDGREGGRKEEGRNKNLRL